MIDPTNNMSELFRKKYRISSARLSNWDYGANAMYFVTICTSGRENFFGEAIQMQCISVETQCIETQFIASLPYGKRSNASTKKIQLNALGKCVEEEWLKTPNLRPDMNLALAEYVVMPNHFHGIIHIGENQYNSAALYDYSSRKEISDNLETQYIGSPVETQCIASLPGNRNSFGPQRKNLSSVVRGFKAAVTTFARKENIRFDWQARFHEHIIGGRKEYLQIANYIKWNPTNWINDELYNINSQR